MPGRWSQRYLSPAVLCICATLLSAILLATLLILLNKAGGVAPLASLPRLRLIGLAWLILAVLVAALLATAFRQSAGNRRRSFWRPLAVSASALVLTAIVAEGVLRVVARPTPLGLSIGRLNLLPYDWRQVQRSSTQWLRRTRQPTSVLDVEDPDLGWDLGRARRSADGMYATSASGFRIGGLDSPLVPDQAAHRVALVGDSFTFGEESGFEETWGRQLERQLPQGTVVLNFGVPSHGPDQTLIKYRRDVRPMNADVTIFTFLSASPLRNLGIYLFLRPDLELPYSKPRFVFMNDSLLPLNSPPIPVEKILDRPSVWSLDLLDHDNNFAVGQWAAPLATGSHVSRYLVSRFPRYPRAEESISDDTVIELGARIIEKIVSEIRAAGSVPVVIALPVRADLSGGPTGLRDGVIAALAGWNIPVLDLGPCLLRQLNITEIFVAESRHRSTQDDPGPAHYSARGNAAVASCLAPQVRAILQARGH